MMLHRGWRLVVFILTLALGATAALAADTSQPKTPPRTVADITALLDQYQPDQARVAERKAVLAEPPPQTSDQKTLAKYWLRRAAIAEESGYGHEVIKSLRTVVELGGAENLENDMARLANAEYLTGNLRDYLKTSQLLLEGNVVSATVGNTINHGGGRALAFAKLGQLDEARRYMALAESTYHGAPKGGVWGSYFTMVFEATNAGFLAMQGKLVEAEAASRRTLDADLANLRDNRFRPGTVAAGFENIALVHRAYSCWILTQAGKFTEAEELGRAALIDAIRMRGGASQTVAQVVSRFAPLLIAQGRLAEAENLIGKVIKTLAAGGVPDSSHLSIELRLELAETLVGQGRFRDGLAQYQKAYDSLGDWPDNRARAVPGSSTWALALLKAKRPADAVTMLSHLVPRSVEWLGPRHIDTAELIGVKGMALAAKGDKTAALEAYRNALPVLLNAAISHGDEPSPLRTQRLRLILEAYLGLLGEIRGTPLEASAGIDAANEAFRLTDALSSQNTQSAVAASALRAAANDPRIGSEIRKEQDLSQEMVALHKILRDLMNAPADQQLPRVIADMKARIEAIKQERTTLQADIEKRFPAYANLIRPQPPSLAEARAILQSGEALINIFTTDTATYLWAFKKDGPVVFSSVKLNREELARRVQTLRKALDPGDVDLTNGIPDFDLNTAYRLYADILVPVAAGWQGASHLLIAANGALSQLPLAVLPTAQVTVKPDPKLPYAQFKDVPWLVRQAAFTQLPSVNALMALRKLPAASAERSAFVGFGDPQFTESPIQVASATRRLRNLSVSRPSQAEVEQAKPVEWMDYAKIPSLPDTRDEILALALALKADPENDVFLGSQASTANVKKMDLSKRRVVAFATHGLLAGDFPGVSEPSLALANPGGGQHGLLTLEDIMGLKLDADWVVLSACNTAAGDGQGADALSGLGRGFFYAGSRALLVTHWPVESGSARLLVTGLFERQAANAKLSRAEALRQSMLALMQQKNADANFAYAHPLFWAPYALVGEGGI